MNKRKSDSSKMTARGHPVAKWKLEIKNELDRKEINFPTINEVGCYSVNGTTKEFQDNNYLLKNIFIPPSGWNAKLSEGFQWNLNNGGTEAIKFDSENSKHDTYILEWILRHQGEIRSVFMDPTANDVKIDFICNRNVLKSMCLTLGTANRKSDWSFYACKFKSTIYMRPFETDHPKEEMKKETDNNREHWGDVFEKYMTISNKDDKITPVNKNEGVYIMLKAKMNGHTLLYSAEVDGKDPNIPQNHLDSHGLLKSTVCYIELKLGNDRLEKSRFYSGKLVYWWLQAVLGGIPKIICGIRNEDGIVKELKTFHVKMEKESAEMGKREIGRGSGKTKGKRQKTEKLECGRMETKDEGTVIYLDDTKEACLKTCAKILDFVKKCVQDDNRGTVYKFQHKDKESFVMCEKLDDPVKYEKILPKWYTDQSRNPL